ncbi:outer membrane protein assembly factor BamE [Candidatus Woesearchaeota archaeon]|nr:outer membrane protein assembly factor BamE [Candidatus Woesearchaeota archaeon]
MKKIILTLLILVLLVGCSERDEEMDVMDINEMYNKIQTGMTFDEVRSLLGEPSSVQKMETDEYWYYIKGVNMLQISFIEGKVASRTGYIKEK